MDDFSKNSRKELKTQRKNSKLKEQNSMPRRSCPLPPTLPTVMFKKKPGVDDIVTRLSSACLFAKSLRIFQWSKVASAHFEKCVTAINLGNCELTIFFSLPLHFSSDVHQRKWTWSADTWPDLLTLWTLTPPTPSHNWSKSEPPNMATTTTLSRHLPLENRTKPNFSAGTPHAGKPCWTHSYALILNFQLQNRGVEPTWSTTWWARHCTLLQALVCQTFTPSTRRKGMPPRGVQKSATSRKGTF